MHLTQKERIALRFAGPGDASIVRTALHEGADLRILRKEKCFTFRERFEVVWFNDLGEHDVARVIHSVTKREVIVRISTTSPFFIELIDAENGTFTQTEANFLIPKETKPN